MNDRNRGSAPVTPTPGQRAALGEFNAAVRKATDALAQLTAQVKRVGPLLDQPVTLVLTLIRDAASTDVEAARIDRARAAVGAIDVELRSVGRLYVEAVDRCEELIAAAARARRP